ncbi:M56 family metallopeptidase [Fulvivirga lutimaris]|uniref:M56 family metallopeptidase n=1 Tax=Fulvivirga lutimaris TaxID=1819566 RepID=UPI0016270D3A|nr:M56 family metallopeptidase [Fulvivirga lutimaris]
MIDLLKNIDLVVPMIGHTLIHSLWQGLLVYCLLFLVLAIFRVSNSKIRYTFSVAALGVYLISTVVTFFWLFDPAVSMGGGVKNIQILFDKDFDAVYDFSFTSWLAQNMNIILSVWSTGVLFMVVRLLGGWYLLTRIKKNALSCSNELWLNKLKLLKSRLNMTANVILKVSNRVDVPMVFGTIKPIIIIPTSLLTGLSDDQLEIILAHELAHVKRYDFIVNVLQHLVEVVFFFNPFVWLISNLIRTERENACDDLALSVSGDSYSLASTLLRVEEIRRQPQLALYFSNNNNIFHRIKRLTGMKTQNLLDTRMVILVLFAASLMSFSWYSINAKNQQKKEEPLEVESFEPPYIDVNLNVEVDPQIDVEPDLDLSINEEVAPETILVEADTTEKDKDAWRYEKRVPPVAPAHPVPSIPDLPPMPPMVLDEWTEAFALKFSEQFADFYEEHKEEMELMMDELQETMSSIDTERFEEARFMKEMAMRQREMALAQRELTRFDEEHWREEVERARTLAKEQMELERESMRSLREEMGQLEREMKVFEQKMKKFDEELKDELVKDGYIKSSEDIETLDVNDDGEFTVNGKKMSSKDSKKYAEIYEKYFDSDVKGLRYHN